MGTVYSYKTFFKSLVLHLSFRLGFVSNRTILQLKTENGQKYDYSKKGVT